MLRITFCKLLALDMLFVKSPSSHLLFNASNFPLSGGLLFAFAPPSSSAVTRFFFSMQLLDPG